MPAVATRKKNKVSDKPVTTARKGVVKTGAVKKCMRFIATNSSILDAEW